MINCMMISSEISCLIKYMMTSSEIACWYVDMIGDCLRYMWKITCRNILMRSVKIWRFMSPYSNCNRSSCQVSWLYTIVRSFSCAVRASRQLTMELCIFWTSTKTDHCGRRRTSRLARAHTLPTAARRRDSLGPRDERQGRTQAPIGKGVFAGIPHPAPLMLSSNPPKLTQWVLRADTLRLNLCSKKGHATELN